MQISFKYSIIIISIFSGFILFISNTNNLIIQNNKSSLPITVYENEKIENENKILKKTKEETTILSKKT
jgi:hypothetical protein